MARTAKVFMTNRSQAVRLPKEYQFSTAEVFIRKGLIAAGPDGALRADVDISLVDQTGQMAEGRLTRGQNPVLVTFEIVLEEVGGEMA